MLRKLSEFFGNHRAPSGYRPGVTLEHVRRNLGDMQFVSLEPSRGQFALTDGTLSFEVQERTQSELLMHLVLSDFQLKVASQGQGMACIDIRHTGLLQRQDIRCRASSGDEQTLAPLVEVLQHDTELHEALMPLDFKRLQIKREKDQWLVTLEHMAASEVVNRMPSFRRYIRLSDEQRNALVASLMALQRILRCY
ncbi:MAG: DUF3156 family protein [Pseudomonas sp.]|uniref:DUF3156 family protein n=1 Tax=Pseudomonas sp. TaxID=306 RepID=UPI003982ADE6